MIIIKSRLIFGIIKKIISALFNVIYYVFNIFHLSLTLLIAVVGVILFVTGVFHNYPSVKLIFAILLALSIFYAIFATIKSLLGLGRKKEHKSVQVMKVDKPEEENANNAQSVTEKAHSQQNFEAQFKGDNKVEQPTSRFIGYFKVKQNPNYVMAEYTDRYELFRVTENGLKFVRRDFKN